MSLHHYYARHPPYGLPPIAHLTVTLADGSIPSVLFMTKSTWVRLPLLLVIMAAVSVVANVVASALGGSAVGGLVAGVSMAVLAVVAYRGAVRWLERRTASEVALPPRGLGSGVLTGFGLFAVTIGGIALAGGYRVTGWGSFGGAVALLGLMASVAVTEELLFRAILFRVVEGWVGTWGALAISSVLFGLLHLVNPGATLFGALAIAVEAGGMLGAAYAATRTLWLPIGLHLGWNFAQAGIFGATVSGADTDTAGLLRAVSSGPSLISGGGFGPEASVFALLACAVPTVVLLRLARRRGRLLPPARRRAAGPAGLAGLAGPAGPAGLAGPAGPAAGSTGVAGR